MKHVCTECEHIRRNFMALEYSKCAVSKKDHLSNEESSLQFCGIVNRGGDCAKFEPAKPKPHRTLWEWFMEKINATPR